MASNEAVTATLARSSGSSKPTPTGSGVSNIVWCAARFGKWCHFTETVTTVETIGGGNVVTIRAAGNESTKQAVVVGLKKVKVPGGHTVTVTVGLNGTGQQFLKRFGNVPATVSVQLLRAGKLTTIVRRKLTIKPKKAPKKPRKTASHSAFLRSVRLTWPTL
jgi:hypothetical protein